jgi:hypothetical protein
MGERSRRKNACPREGQRNHSPLKGEPSGYLAWHEWAEHKSQTHYPTKCPDCGLFVVWKPNSTEDRST